MSDDEQSRKRCAECVLHSPAFDVSTDAGQADLIEHYLTEHPESSVFADVVSGSCVRAGCNDCEQLFWAVVNLGHDASGERAELTADAYCPECESGDPIRQLLVETVSPNLYVQSEGEPFEDDLNRDDGGEVTTNE